MFKILAKKIHTGAHVLLWIGGINLGMLGIFKTNVIANVLADWPWLINPTYALIGISTVYIIANHKNSCNLCIDKKTNKKVKNSLSQK
ncbi:MAG: DUF378 domain-containing protein [Patescibacteria group bacterium]|nr:DUF378 domain-containing protein [Patescibacteria group bacterium]